MQNLEENNRFEIKNETKDQVNRDLNSAKMHLWAKFWNSDFSQWWLIMQTISQAQNEENCEI